MDEKSYKIGSRATATRILSSCLVELGYDDITADSARWIIERERVIIQLRIICERFGDNDWDEKLHLADVIDKHLGRHLFGKK